VSSNEEHLATRRAAGLFDFSFMGLYEFPGLAAVQPVQTRALHALTIGQIAYTLILNPDGSVFNDATVWRLADGRFWLFSGRRSDFARFKDHARDRSGELAILALQGPASGRILARLVGEQAVLSLRYFRFAEMKDLVVARLGYSGELGYELLVPASAAPALRRELLKAGDVAPCGWDAANSLRIEAGYVLFEREIDGRANPRELGLERFISDPATKFQLRKRLVGLEILDEQAPPAVPAAKVTSECFSPILGKAIALGYADAGLDTKKPVRLADGRSGRVARLPFYDPDRRLPRAAPL
jgi:glycine cleavage system aminomethyltransferase T